MEFLEIYIHLRALFLFLFYVILQANCDNLSVI